MRFGIVGTNFVSDFFMEGAKEVKECEIVAVCDKTEEGARKFAEKYNIPHFYGSYQDMAKAGIIDAAYVATPNSTHLEISKYFLSLEIPTFCEKPMTSNINQVNEMIECAIEHNTYLHEGIVPLYTPHFQTIKENIKRVGKIRQVTINMAQYSSRYDAYLRGENPTTFRNELSNGALMDLGIYVFALCIALFGRPKKILSAANLLDTKADVAGSSILIYDGFNANLSYSKASDTENKVEICGEEGQLIIGHPTTFKSIVFVDRKTKEKTDLYPKAGHSFSYEISDMIEQIKKGHIESSKVPFELSKLIHEVLTEARKQSGIIFPCD